MSDKGKVVQKERYMKILGVLNEHQGVRVFGPVIRDLYPEDVLCINLEYLHDCGYVKANMRFSKDNIWNFGDARILPKGISYFEENGGLYKESSKVVIEFEASSIKKMIEEYIQATQNDKTIKNKFVEAIRNAPTEGLKALTGQILQEGLKASPHIWQLIESTLCH